MPFLDWSSKSKQTKLDGNLLLESVIYPQPELQKGIGSPNRLILGDNLRIMNALLPTYENKIDLIYADPPFFTNKGYSTRVGRDEDSRKPEEWELAEGYQDEWEDLNAYLDMLYPRLRLMYKLLAPTGSFFLHLDWHANSYARILLDEIFGYNNYRNEIIWTYHGPSPIKRAFNRKHDMILFYSKTDQYKFNVDDVRVPYADNTVATFKSSKKAGFGKVPDLKRGKVPEDWWYFPVVARLHNERTGYPTQKPEALMERIILASTSPGDLVADFFVGAGTTAVVAQRLERCFISSDDQPQAVQTSRSRLVQALGDHTEYISKEQDKSRLLHIEREENTPPTSFLKKEEPGIKPILKDGKLSLPPESISQVVYWEVDPDWTEGVFQSRYQAVRPWRKGEIAAEISLGEHNPGNVCVRLTLVSGDQFQVVI